MFKNVLITGGCGSIGHRACVKLLSIPTIMSVVSYDRIDPNINPCIIKLHRTDDRCHLVVGNVTNTNYLHQTLIKYDIDTVIHLAGSKSIHISPLTSEHLVDNVVGTQCVLEAVKLTDACRKTLNVGVGCEDNSITTISYGLDVPRISHVFESYDRIINIKLFSVCPCGDGDGDGGDGSGDGGGDDIMDLFKQGGVIQYIPRVARIEKKDTSTYSLSEYTGITNGRVVKHIDSILDSDQILNTVNLISGTVLTYSKQLIQQHDITVSPDNASDIKSPGRTDSSHTHILHSVTVNSNIYKHDTSVSVPVHDYGECDDVTDITDLHRKYILTLDSTPIHYRRWGFMTGVKWGDVRELYVNNTMFSHVYVLSLLRRVDKWDNMVRRLHDNDILRYERFIGIDGADDFKDWNNYNQKPLTREEHIRKHKFITSPGSWAILNSMKRMILDAKYKKYHNIMVFQDDVLFHKQFKRELSRIATTTPMDWKLLYLGASQHRFCDTVEMTPFGFYYPRGTADGAFATAIDHSVYDQLLAEIDKMDKPFDSGALSEVQKSYPYQALVLQPNLCVADVTSSDLRNPRDQKKIAHQFHWDMSLYNTI